MNIQKLIARAGLMMLGTAIATNLLAIEASAKPKKQKTSVISSCSSVSDPDFVNVTILKVGEKTIAFLQNYYNEGENYAEDVIEVRLGGLEGDTSSWFQQVEGSYPKISKISKAPTNKTKGAMIIVPNYGVGSGKLDALSGPAGDQHSERQECSTKREIQPNF
jgi:hypothetical protein